MYFKIFFLLLFVIFITACKKKEVKEPDPHVNTFSANVNGTPFVSTSVVSERSMPSPGDPLGTTPVFIYAKGINGNSITLFLYHYNGTIKIFTAQVQLIGAYNIFQSGVMVSSSPSINGEISLTSIDKTKYNDGEVVTGTFYFDTDATFGTYNITDGKFSVYVPY
jgi:hypothetical protein